MDKTLKILLLFGLSLEGTHAFGASSDMFPTASAYAYGGYSVYKSEMVQSNDTAFTVGYGFEFFAGRERDWGMGLNREAAQLAFALNSSKIAINADIYKITYALGPVWFGPLFNYTLWDVAAPPDLDANEFIDQNTAYPATSEHKLTGIAFAPLTKLNPNLDPIDAPRCAIEGAGCLFVKSVNEKVYIFDAKAQASGATLAELLRQTRDSLCKD